MAFLLNPLFFLFFFLSSSLSIYSLNTVSISQTLSHTSICALHNSNHQPPQSLLNCTSFPQGIQLQLNSNTSFSEIAGGNGFLCALRPPIPSSSSSSSNSSMFCWRFSSNATNVPPKRVYQGPVVQNLNAGNTQVCGLAGSTNNNNTLNCWQWREFNYTASSMIMNNLSSIAAGENFVCGLSSDTNKIHCTGSNTIVVDHKRTANYSVIAAATTYACAIFSSNGSLDCWGNTPPVPLPQGNFISLALGENRGCAIRAINQTVECWGSENFSMPLSSRETYFEAITAKQSVFCGVKSDDFSLHCWGKNDILGLNGTKVFDNVLPGPCRNENECPCGPLSNSASLCNQGIICKPCVSRILAESQTPPPPPPPSGGSSQGGNSDWSNKMVAFLVVGCVGSVSLLLVLAFFLYKYCKRRGCRRVHDSGRLEDDPEGSPEAQPAEGAVLEKRLSHLISLGNGGHLEEFPLQLLMKVTNNFSEYHKIGTGSFGSVYHATLEDGRQVAIKRAEISPSSPSYRIQGGTTKRQQEKDQDHAFVNELESLSRLNHKNLVRLLGFFEDDHERILVYEFMTNGSLNDHLHDLNTSSSSDSPLTSWAGRIKIALDAARGIEYLHQYAMPPIIHRDIKSANILLDAKWTAKVSDFGLSLMGPDPDEDGHSHLSLLAAGTVGYMDPEYYRLQLLTTKSDVYSFGVVLLELLCGYRAIHRNEHGMPRNVVDFVVPYIVQDEIHRVLDTRVPPPTPYEIEGVAFVGYLAADCVRPEGRDRPSMTQVVDSLEKALAACLLPPNLSWSSTTASSDLSHTLN